MSRLLLYLETLTIDLHRKKEMSIMRWFDRLPEARNAILLGRKIVDKKTMVRILAVLSFIIKEYTYLSLATYLMGLKILECR